MLKSLLFLFLTNPFASSQVLEGPQLSKDNSYSYSECLQEYLEQPKTYQKKLQLYYEAIKFCRATSKKRDLDADVFLSNQDTTPPELLSFSIDPQVVDVTSQSQIVNITMRIADSESEVESPSVTARSTVNDASTGFASVSLIDGDTSDGTWRAELTIPQGTTAGEWSVNVFPISDSADNATGFNPGPSANQSFEVISNATDVTPPELLSFSIDPQVVDVTAQSQIVNVTMRIADSESEVESPSVTARSTVNDASTGFASVSLIDGDRSDGIWRAELTLPQGTTAGEWSINVFPISDTADNATGFNPGPSANQSFEVISNATDVTPPELLSFSIDPQMVDVTSQSQIVNVTMRIADSESEVESPSVTARSTINDASTGFASVSLIDGDTSDGTWRAELTIPQGTTAGKWSVNVFPITDTADNATGFNPGPSANQSFDVTNQSDKVRTKFDYDSDGKADLVFRRPAEAEWHVLNSSGVDRVSDNSDGITVAKFGLDPADIPLAGDFDEDGINDFAVRRPSNFYWYVLNSSGSDLITFNNDGISRRTFGLHENDIPVPADYDGDGKTDLAVRRPSNQTWYILNSSGIDYLTGNSDGITRRAFGLQEGDIPVPADYDGDGKTDLAVRRPSTKTWYILNSSGIDELTGNSDGITRRQFGLQEDDIPVPADYDGDGKTDLAVRRPSNQTWYILNSSGVDNLTGNSDGISRRPFGLQEEDIPVPADYDGDGKTDLAVRRPSNQTWYILNSSGIDNLTHNADGITRKEFGSQETDIPIAAPINIVKAMLKAALPNGIPVANINASTDVNVQSTVILDGTNSSDPDGQTLNYLWTIKSKPENSSAQLESRNSETSSFFPDVEGTYTISLIVSDGIDSSQETTIELRATQSELKLYKKEFFWFFGDYEEVSFPYSTSGSVTMNVSGIPRPTTVTIDTFKLEAIGGDFTITNLSASDSTNFVDPFFEGLEDGYVIKDGEEVEFELVSPLTGGRTVRLKFQFEVAETGDTFDASYNLTTN